jgi:hypothetical protein
MKKRFYVALLVAFALGVQWGLAQAPPAPTDLVASLVKTLPPTVDLSWKSSVRPTMYSFFKVYRSVEDSNHFSLLGATKDTMFNDHYVAPGHTYYYRVTLLVARNDSTILESLPSNTASILVPPPSGKGHGMIIGSVTDSVTGKGLSHILIMFYRRPSQIVSDMPTWVPQTWTDSLGHYKAILDTGSYLVLAQPLRLPWAGSLMPISLYRPQWYKHVFSPKEATPVKADSPASVANFDLTKWPLPAFVNLKGVVKDTAGNPLANALVTILRTPQELAMTSSALGIADLTTDEDCDIDDFGRVRGVVWKGWTGTDGSYTARIPAGHTYLAMAIKREYLPQYFDHKKSILEATPIKIPWTTSDTSGFDFNLKMRQIFLNSISGIVQDSMHVRVPSHILLFPVRHQPWFPYIRFGSTDSVGAYTLHNIPTGKYFVMALPYAKYAPAFYKAGFYGERHWKDADTVLVLNTVTGIDIGVVPVKSVGVASVSGLVTSAGAPVQGVSVLALDEQGSVAGYGMTDDNGSYTMDGVPSGNLTIAVDREGYVGAQGAVSISPVDFSVNKSFDIAGVTAVSEGTVLPQAFSLEQNYPNPFNPSTNISFSLPSTSVVTLKVYNLVGQEVATLASGTLAAGNHQLSWSGTDALGHTVASGVYFYRLQASDVKGGGNFVRTMKMVLVK